MCILINRFILQQISIFFLPALFFPLFFNNQFFPRCWLTFQFSDVIESENDNNGREKKNGQSTKKKIITCEIFPSNIEVVNSISSSLAAYTYIFFWFISLLICCNFDPIYVWMIFYTIQNEIVAAVNSSPKIEYNMWMGKYYTEIEKLIGLKSLHSTFINPHTKFKVNVWER